MATFDRHWMKPQALAFLDKFIVVINLTWLYRIFPEILLPQMHLLMKKRFKLRPPSEPPHLFPFLVFVLLRIEGYLIQKPLRVSVKGVCSQGSHISQIVE